MQVLETSENFFEQQFINSFNDNQKEYVLQRFLGKGGFSTGVFLAEREDDKKQRVIKFVPKINKAGEFLAGQRIRKEVHALMALEHPNVVKTFGDLSFIFEEKPYLGIITEYFPEGDLREKLASGQKLSADNIIKILEQIALALEFIKNRGFVHRDIKPDNIFIETLKDNQVSVRIGDFGFAQRPEEILSLPHSLFSAPETFEQNIKIDSAAADIYSLGCTAYFLLSNCQYPYHRELWHSQDEVFIRDRLGGRKYFYPLQAVKPEINIKEVNGILKKALSSDPKRRYTSAGFFVNELKQALATSGIAMELPIFNSSQNPLTINLSGELPFIPTVSGEASSLHRITRNRS